MSAQHTPGPWTPAYIGVGQWNIVGSGRVVAHVANHGLPSFHAEQEAVAHLLAAAPRMLEQIQLLFALLPLVSPEDILGPHSSLLDDMRATLAELGSAS